MRTTSSTPLRRTYPKVLLLPVDIKEQLSWRGKDVFGVYNFKDLSTFVDNEELVELLLINDPIGPLKLNTLIGKDNLLRAWSVSSDTDQHKSTLDAVDIQYQIEVKKEKELPHRVETELEYQVLHDLDTIYFVFNPNILNLKDNTMVKGLERLVVREVIKTLHLFFEPHEVAQSPWFKMYLVDMKSTK